MKDAALELVRGESESRFEIAGMRDQLIHHYFGVDLEVVWRVVEVEIDPLVAVVQRLIVEYNNTNS